MASEKHGMVEGWRKDNEEIIYAPVGKDDFVTFTNVSYETNGWLGKYRDYECYRKMLGPTKLHGIALRTKSGP